MREIFGAPERGGSLKGPKGFRGLTAQLDEVLKNVQKKNDLRKGGNWDEKNSQRRNCLEQSREWKGLIKSKNGKALLGQMQGQNMAGSTQWGLLEMKQSEGVMFRRWVQEKGGGLR